MIAVGAPYGDMIPKTAGMATDAFMPGAIFLLFVLVGGVNVLLQAIEDEKRSLIAPFFKNGLMWLGFAIPFLLLSWNALHSNIPSHTSLI